MANQRPTVPGSPYTRIIRHYSVESEVPDNTISNLFPTEDNYVPVTSNSSLTLRSPKSLSQLCIEEVCRSLPMLDGALPPGLPQDIIDRIVQCLNSHCALNGTTLRALKFCEVGALSLANCRGVTDDWLRSLNEESFSLTHPSKNKSVSEICGHNLSEEANCYIVRDGILKDCRSQSPTVDSHAFDSSLHRSPVAGDSSSSTGSFVSAVSRSLCDTSSPLKSDNVWEKSMDFHYTLPSPFSSPTITSSLTLLDLRGSQRLTDRGLLQLHSLNALEIAKLDNCHSIVGKGLIAFASSHRLHALSLANCRRLSDEGIVNISHLTSITSLSLDGCRSLTDQSLEAISNLKNLEKLDLSQCDLITNVGIRYLKPLSSLSELSLGWCRLIDDMGIEELVMQQASRSKTLKILRLARLSITDNGVGFLAELKSLTELDLNGCSRIGSVALGAVLENLVHLTSLDVSYCPSIM